MAEIRQPSSASALRVAPSRRFEESPRELLGMAGEWRKVVAGPGDALNLSSGQRLSAVRGKLDPTAPHTGIRYEKGGTPVVTDVPNPDRPDGRWDPYAFLPRFVFDAKEDAFPVAPDFDGDTDFGNNGPATADGPPGSYEDGVIGGKQPLSGGFAVSKKGEYTVLTYSFYYAHNKAQHYHPGDYSHAQVYLKPGPSGKLEPAYMATSWHHGSVLTPWKDLAKDQDGRPIVGVNLGTHALQPFGRGQRAPEDGLQIAGDGQAMNGGRSLGHRLTFEAFQGNVDGARRLDATHPASRPRLESMRWGSAGLAPLSPEAYQRAPGPWRQLAAPVLAKAEHVAERVLEPVKDAGSWARKQLRRLPGL